MNKPYKALRFRVSYSDDSTPGPHRSITIHRWRDMEVVSRIYSSMDDVNVAIFHPHPGFGLVYGSKQGRVLAIEGARSPDEANTPDVALNSR